MDGKYLRAVAEIDEKAKELGDAIQGAEDIDAAFEAYKAYLRTLPVSYVEEYTVMPLDQTELDALVGKTLGELFEAGYDYSSSYEDLTGNIIFGLANGVYEYSVVVDTDLAGYEQHQENGSYDDLVVKSAEFSGFSVNAADMTYHADGTVEETEDFGFGEYEDLMNEIGKAITDAEETGTVDFESLLSVLAEKHPESVEMIRMVLEMYQELSGGEAVPAE